MNEERWLLDMMQSQKWIALWGYGGRIADVSLHAFDTLEDAKRFVQGLGAPHKGGDEYAIHHWNGRSLQQVAVYDADYCDGEDVSMWPDDCAFQRDMKAGGSIADWFFGRK